MRALNLLIREGMLAGLHSLRHTYVSLLIAQGEDIGYIADQVGHSATRLTQDLYRHVFKGARVESMRRRNAAIPSGNHPVPRRVHAARD